MFYSLKLWNLDALDLRVIVLVLKAFSFESVFLHPDVVESAHCVEIWDLLERLELFLGLVKIEHALDAIEVFSDVVLVLHHGKSSLNLVFVHFY
jgi:hypothetical protein